VQRKRAGCGAGWSALLAGQTTRQPHEAELLVGCKNECRASFADQDAACSGLRFGFSIAELADLAVAIETFFRSMNRDHGTSCSKREVA
jgi:hypothetical protein